VSVSVRFITGNDQTLVVQEAAWSSGSVWTSAENLAPTRIQFPDCPVCSKSLYRLSYPGPRKLIRGGVKFINVWKT